MRGGGLSAFETPRGQERSKGRDQSREVERVQKDRESRGQEVERGQKLKREVEISKYFKRDRDRGERQRSRKRFQERDFKTSRL